MKKLPLVAVTLISLFAGVFLYTPASKAAATFGVSPPWVKNDHMLPGDTHEETVYLIRDPGDTKQELTDFSISGDQNLQKWINSSDIKKLILEAGQKQTPMKVVISVPKDAAIGDYKGSIFFHMTDVTDKGAEQTGGVGLGFGGNIEIEIAVIEPPKKPGLPGATQTKTPEVPSPSVPAAETELKPVAPACPDCPTCPVCPETTNSCGTSSWVKLILALAALIGAVAGLLFVLNKRRQSKAPEAPATTSPPSPAP